MICHDCKPIYGIQITGAAGYTFPVVGIKLCQKHAMVDKLAESLRELLYVSGLYVSGFDVDEIGKLLAEYDATSASSPRT